MAGGVLQLFAKGTEDVYISGNPTITFFKTVYRRHTNFSRNELNLTFTNKLDFGKEGYCRLEHYGDLLHRMFLQVTLPEIDIVYRSFTIKEIMDLLNNVYYIKWTTDKSPEDIFTASDAEEVYTLIDEKVKSINDDIRVYNQFITLLSEPNLFYPETWKTDNPDISDTQDNYVTGISDASLIYFDDVVGARTSPDRHAGHAKT